MNNKSIHGKLIAWAILSALLVLTGLLAPLQAQRTDARTLIDSKEIESLFDPIFAEQMKRLHIPGAVVAVVKDDKILFAKGYGFANLEKRTPVTADRTIFRIGSITKVFTATAVVQLADRGRINLKDDVNKYLKETRVADTYPNPVTFAHLLTHTAGFDEISLGRRATSADKVLPLGEFLKTRLRRRLPPGEIISYSTYGITLAGHLVELISGISLKEYFNRNIFKPLQMDRTSHGPVPANLLPDLATGYEYQENKHIPMAFEYFHTHPASDINSTATDMARFMIAHLQEGRYGRARILSSKAARDMHRQHFTNHPRLDGWAYGFSVSRSNNLSGVGHGGSMDGYSSSIYLMPEQKIGLYLACNTEAGGFGLSSAVRRAFLNRYFPAQPMARTAPAPPRAREDLRRFTGKYRWDVYCHTCPADARGFFPDEIEVTAGDDGTLSIWGDRWIQIEPLVFRLVLDPSDPREILIAFREDSKGKITYLLSGTNASEKVQ